MTPLRHALTDSKTPTNGAATPAAFEFECPLTVFKADDAPEGKKRRIAGLVSTDRLDRQNERILQDGLNFEDFLANGFYNDNHSGQTCDILGYPESVQQFAPGDKLPDGAVADSNCTWVEGYLLDTKKADDIWELAQALQKTKRRLGYSVEGSIESRAGNDGSVIAKAKVRNVAITNCFLGSTRVLASARGVSRRIYNGPVINLELASGHKVTGTPNHPVLTQRGWVALGEIDKLTDRVGRSLGEPGKISRIGQDVKNMPPRLDEIFDAAQVSGGVHHVRPGLKGDFHGDGSDSDVDIVSAAGLLSDTGETLFGEHFGNLLLSIADASDLGFVAQRHSGKFRIRPNSASSGFWARFLPESLVFRRSVGPSHCTGSSNVSVDSRSDDHIVNARPRYLENVCEALTTLALKVKSNYSSFLTFCERLFLGIDVDPSCAQHSPHAYVAGSEFFADRNRALSRQIHRNPRIGVVGVSDFFGASGNAGFVHDVINAGFAGASSGSDCGSVLTGAISFEDVRSLSISNYTGHVYNLDSVPGWYVANGIASKNCAVNTDSRLEILARSLTAQNRILRRSMTLTDSAGSAGPVRPNKPYTGKGAGQVLSRESVGGAKKKKRKSDTLTRSEAVAYVQAQVPGCSEALARAIVFRTIHSKVHP